MAVVKPHYTGNTGREQGEKGHKKAPPPAHFLMRIGKGGGLKNPLHSIIIKATQLNGKETDMRDELTAKDIELMRRELDHRRIELRPRLLEAVKEARAFGDLSENFEYKAAKQEKNRNESRIRFLENMIRTAVIIDDRSAADAVGLYDKVTVYLEDDDETETYQIVTTMRQDALHGRISKESPVGMALMGRRVGDRVRVQVGEGGYDMVIRSIEKTEDDGSAPLNSF